MDRFSHKKRVEFCETDSAGIAHFSSLAIYMEQAEHALFRHLGLTVFSHIVSPADEPSGENPHLDVTWPRVHISLDFLGPARFEELLDVDVSISKLGESSVSFDHRIHCSGRPVARGKSISVCCKLDRTGALGLVKCPIPEFIRTKLTTFLKPI